MSSGYKDIPLVGTAGVSSLNGNTGDVTLVEGTGIDIAVGGNDVTISATGANATLSNLDTPTAINRDLTFENASHSIKTPAASGATGSLTIASGNSSANSSGSITVTTGTASATRGKIKLIDGSEGTAGDIWTSTGTGGEGAWAAAPAGGGLTKRTFTLTAANLAGQASQSANITLSGSIPEDEAIIAIYAIQISDCTPTSGTLNAMTIDPKYNGFVSIINSPIDNGDNTGFWIPQTQTAGNDCRQIINSSQGAEGVITIKMQCDITDGSANLEDLTGGEIRVVALTQSIAP